MVLKETSLIITSGNSTTTAFIPGSSQGISTSAIAQNYALTNNLGQPRPAPTAGNQTMGTPFGNANNFQVMLPQAFNNVVKTEIRYFFMENGIDNVYDESYDNQGSLISVGNNTFYIRQGYDSNNPNAGYQHTIVIPSGYYDRRSLSQVILNLVNLIDASANADSVCTIPSATLSSPIYNTTVSGGFLLPAQNFTTCEIGSDGIFRLEALASSAIGTDWAISFKNRSNNNQKILTQVLLGFAIPSLFNATSEFEPILLNGIYTLSSPYVSVIDVYNYILIQSQKLGSRVMSTTGIEAYCIVPMSGNNTQIASQTGQFCYDGGNYSLDSAYFDTPRRLDVIDIRLADSTGALLDIGENTISIVIRIIQSV